MTDKFCKKCNHSCHCESCCFSHEDCSCNKCGCSKDGGIVIDDTGECEGCQ